MATMPEPPPAGGMRRPVLDPDEIAVSDQCKQCGETYHITRAAVAFFEDRDLAIPKRCLSCRELNRQEHKRRKGRPSGEEAGAGGE